MVSNTRASIAAYAESVDDGIGDEVRRRLFQAIWVDGRHRGTVAPDGGPLSAAGHRRVQQWRREWLDLPEQITPVVVGPEDPVAAAGGLAYLAELVHTSRTG